MNKNTNIVTTLSELDSLLMDAYTWLEHDATHLVAMRMLGDSYPEFNLVPHALLAEKHPDFPRAVLAQIDFAFKQDRESPGAEGALVYDTLDVLCNGTILLNDVDNTPRNLYEIKDIKDMGRRGKLVSIEAVLVDLAYVENISKSIPFVVKRDLRRVLFSVEHLSAKYPGWYERWKLGKELGVESPTLMHAVFTSNASLENTPIMSGVLFD